MKNYKINLHSKKKFWNVPFRKRQVVAFSEMDRSVLGTKSFHSKIIHFRSPMKPTFFLMKYDISLPKGLFHSLFEMNHIVKENFLFPKQIGPFQKGQLLVFSETECFRIFSYSVIISNRNFSFRMNRNYRK